MHSFHHSRGRILFEVLCALAVSASCTGAWIQTGASALLLAAAVAALFGVVHLFDLRQPSTAAAVEPMRVEREPEIQQRVAGSPDVENSSTATEPLPVTEIGRADARPIEVVAVPPSGSRRKGGSRKGSGRRASPRKTAEVIEFAPADEAQPAPLVEIAEPAHREEPEVVDLTPRAESDEVTSEEFGEPAQVPHAPLFEPEPFVRMPRPAFGRKAG